MSTLTDRVALVTGAGAGLGPAPPGALAPPGAHGAGVDHAQVTDVLLQNE